MMTDEEARGVHSLAMLTFVGFFFFAAVFHYLCWQWRPWFGKPMSYGAAQLMDVAHSATRFLS